MKRSIAAAAALAALSAAAQAALPMPPLEYYGRTLYQTGGVGEREAAEMRRVAHQNPLTLLAWPAQDGAS